MLRIILWSWGLSLTFWSLFCYFTFHPKSHMDNNTFWILFWLIIIGYFAFRDYWYNRD